MDSNRNAEDELLVTATQSFVELEHVFPKLTSNASKQVRGARHNFEQPLRF
jgi:hypothetical protein